MSPHVVLGDVVMELAFDRIDLSNFKSFIGTQRIDLEGIGVHHVRGVNVKHKRLGPNGTGKSSIFDALCWCLYGRTPKGLRNPDVRPWTGEEGERTWVRVRVFVGTKLRRIVRSIAPNKLTLDGKKVDQAAIDRLLGISFELFTHTVLLPQGQPLFFDMSPKQKMELFVDVLQLDKWDARSKAASEFHRKLQKEHIHMSGQRTSIKQQLEHVTKQLKGAKREYRAWSDENETKLQTLDFDLKKTAARIAALQNREANADLELEECGMHLKMVREDVRVLRDVFHNAERAVHLDDAQIAALRERRAELLQEKRALKPGSLCPHCQQVILPTHVAAHEKRIDDKLYMLGSSKPSKKLRKARDDAEAALKKMVEKHDEFERREVKARDELDLIAKPLAEARALYASMFKASRDGFAAPNPHKSLVTALRKQRHALLERLRDAEDWVARLGHRSDRAHLWIKGFRDIRLYRVQEVLEQLDVATNAMLEEVGLIGWEIRFDIERDTKKGDAQQGLFVMIKSPDSKKAVRWESWSGGESQRLRLIGSLALSDVLLGQSGVRVSIEVLDELTHFMSDQGVRDIAAFLVQRAKDTERAIFYIDHQAAPSAAFERTIMVVRDKQGSYVR